MNTSNELSKEKTESNEIESKDIFKNLKSDFFLQKLFYNLLKKKSLDIIKYNNKDRSRRRPTLHLAPRETPTLCATPPFPGVQQCGRVRSSGQRVADRHRARGETPRRPR